MKTKRKTANRKSANRRTNGRKVKVDPITLSVVRGVLETTQREMTLSLEKTARSSVFNLAHDYTTALFNAKPEMIRKGRIS
jgi:N-methylhydantoinase B